MTDGNTAAPRARKLRLGVMGEFSAGKSTLCNLLLGARPLTERVTATRLSPVWISRGEPALEREFLDGTRVPVALGDLDSVPIRDTRSIRLYAEAEVLDLFDLIDFPGISDPNMPTDVWQRLVPEVDAILWCTHANQAWRQSEAEVWRTIPQDVRARSLLLVTRFDTLTNERDKARVLARVRHETAGGFAGIFPISLTQALAAGDDADAWDESGAEPFVAHLIELIAELQEQLEQGDIAERAAFVEPALAHDVRAGADAAVDRVTDGESVHLAASGPDDAEPDDTAPGVPQTGPSDPYILQAAHGLDMETDGSLMPQAGFGEPEQEPYAARDAASAAQDTADASADWTAVEIDDMADESESDGDPDESAQHQVASAPVSETTPEPEPEPKPRIKSPISLMPRRGGAPAGASAAPSIMPRRVAAEGGRRTERPRGDAGIRALRIDDLHGEDGAGGSARDSASPESLRSALAPR